MPKENCNGIEGFKFIPSNYNILIVEDSKSLNTIITNSFNKSGFHCFSTDSVSGAKTILLSSDINYVVLDMNLIDGTGYDIVKVCENTKTKIFVLTTQKDIQLREISYQKGVIDFIYKDKDFILKIEQIKAHIENLEKNRFMSVLVVDDSMVAREQLKDIFENRHYNVLTATTTKETLEILNNNNIDLILLDLELADGNGIDFLSKSNSIIKGKGIPVIIVTGNIQSTTIRDGIKAGAVDIIRKPYIIEELTLKADLWIENRRQQLELDCSLNLLEQYKNTVDRSAIVSKTDARGIITYVNEEFCRISGYTKEELMGQPHNIVRHPDMSKDAFAWMWYTIKELKQPWSGEVKNRKKDGSAYWVQATITPILDSNGSIMEYIGLRTDITQQKTIANYFETQLKISSNNFDEAMNLKQEYERAIYFSNILSRTDKDGKIIYVNDKFVEISGYSRDELIGKTHSVISSKEMTKEFYAELWKSISNGDVFQGVIKNRSKNGKIFWSDTTIYPIKNTNHEIIEYMAIKHDLTKIFELNDEIEYTQREIIYKMGEIGETRSKETGNHVKRVAEYSRLLAILYGLGEREADILFTSSPMHDIGKVGIPDSILNKPGKLTPEEFDIMKAHATIGYEVLKGSDREVLKAASIVSYEHHEKYDGSGYPRGLKGEEIHIYGRITAIADVFDALGHDRCYKKAWELDRILALFNEEKGRHFDPYLIELFMNNLDKFLEIRDRLQD